MLTGTGLILLGSLASHAQEIDEEGWIAYTDGLEYGLRQLSEGGPTIYFGEEGWLKFGLRSQWKYEYRDSTGNNDFMLRRNRLKMEGSLLPGTKFKLEGKLDDVGRDGHTQRAVMEDVSLFLNCPRPDHTIRIGLYDAPLSRDTLTSDHRLLLMDRSDLSDGFTSEGLSDNTIGVQLSGYPTDHLEYHLGLYDSEMWGHVTTQLMPMGRVVLQLLDSERGEYDATYPEGGKNFINLGASAGYLGGITGGPGERNLLGYETDLFVALECGFIFQAEYGRIDRDFDGGAPSSISEGWYVQTGYRLPCPVWCNTLEFAYRYQEYDPDLLVFGDLDRKNSIGMNYYWIGHTMKLQSDYTHIDHQGAGSDDVFQVQFQIDF